MGYFVQEYGQSNGANRVDWKLIFCDKKSELSDLPTKETEGKYMELDVDANKIVKPGDEVLFLDSGELYVMGYDTSWVKL